jgi:hypothetical protein
MRRHAAVRKQSKLKPADREDVEMRVLCLSLGILATAHSACQAQSQPSTPAGQLVREVVYNELHDHQNHGSWQYWIQRSSRAGTILERQVETADGPISRLALSDGRPLTPGAQEQEEGRLEKLLNSPEEQSRHVKQFDEDEARIGRILSLLPDAFLYEYDGEENGCFRLRFHPNPDYPSQSIESRVFHAMSGTLWVNARFKRLAHLEGRVDENVDFGFGILGRLYKGGWFRLDRMQVSATDWKTARLEVHMNIRALLVKTFARETSEMRGGFAPVPAGLSLVQGLELLNQDGAQVQGQFQAGAGSSQIASASMAFRPQ